MSGVYIPMEMPKSCPCELVGIGYDLCCSFAGGIPIRVKEYYECCQNDTRPSWCPLIIVPDHGDLVDRQELLKEQLPLMDGSQRIAVVRVMDICSAKVFIPADKEGEG